MKAVVLELLLVSCWGVLGLELQWFKMVSLFFGGSRKINALSFKGLLEARSVLCRHSLQTPFQGPPNCTRLPVIGTWGLLFNAG